MYNLKIMDIFANPKNTGIVRNADGVGECKNTESGEIVKFYIKVEENKVVLCKYKAFGNALLIATGSIVTEMITNKTIKQIEEISAVDILRQLDKIPANKEYCAVMCEVAIKNMIIDYNKKQEKLARELEKEQELLKNKNK